MEWERAILILIFIFSIRVPLVLADGLIIRNTTLSFPRPEEKLNLELKDAIVYIKCSEKIEFYAEVISHETNDTNVKVYFMAEPTIFAEKVEVKVNGIEVEHFRTSLNNTSFLTFYSSLSPDKITKIEISIDGIGPDFKYYLNSLVYYSKANHEKITIEGYCDAKFNDYYPVQLVETNNKFWKKWVWEYSEINTSDPNVLDILLVPETDKCSSDVDCDDNCRYTIDRCVQHTHKECENEAVNGPCIDNDNCCPVGCSYCNDADCYKYVSMCNMTGCYPYKDLMSIEEYRKKECPATTTTSTTITLPTTTSSTTTITTTLSTTTTTTTTIKEIIEKPKPNIFIRIYQRIKNFFKTLLGKWYEIFD